MSDFDTLLNGLRAAAEPTRLRLLAILSRGEFAVTELTEILGQSQPRVSRHLKVLGEAGLLEKFREQHWIYYRVPTDGAGAKFARDLLWRIEPADPTLLADQTRLAAVLEQRRQALAAGGPGESGSAGNCDELASVLAAELGDRGRGALFYYGPSPAILLGALAPRARRVVGMHASRLEVQRARAALHSRGLSHCVLQQGELQSLPQASAEFDTAIVDRSLASQPRPVDALREVTRLLGPSGELLLVEDYEALARRATDNPLNALRDWLAEVGLVCRRLRPIDLDGQHLVLAVAQGQGTVSAAA